MNKPKTNILKLLTICIIVSCIIVCCTQSCSSRAKRIERTDDDQFSTNEVRTDQKQDLPIEKEIADNEVAKLSKVVFYLENSGSMFGYVNGFSEYVDVVSELAEKPEFAAEQTPREFNLINGGKSIKIYEIGNDPSVLKEKLNVRGFHCGDITKSNLNDMFQLALKRAKGDTISILISDGIYDLQKPQSPMNALATEGKETRSRFIERLSEGGVQTLMIKMNSHFKGKYHNAKQKSILLDQDRPYYIWFFGNSTLLNKYFSDKYIASLTGYRDMARFLKYENELVSYKVVSNNRKGKFRFDKHSKNQLIDVEPDRNGGGFQFTIATDFSNLPFSDSYFNTIVNYDCNNTNYSVCEVTNIGNIKIYGLGFTPTHLISIHTNKSPYGEIDICLKNNIPNWIFETNTNDESGIKGDSNHTFGFDFLTKGISGAYTHINQNTNLAKFTILINK